MKITQEVDRRANAAAAKAAQDLDRWKTTPNRTDLRRNGIRRNRDGGRPWPNTRHRTGTASLHTHIVQLAYAGQLARHGRRIRRQP